MKTTKRKSKAAAKKSAKKRAPAKSKKPVNMVEVRKSISNLVGASADEIASKVIEVAKTGALAPAKYMFEVAGLYPATESGTAKPEEDSLAHILVNRLRSLPEPAGAEGGDEAAPDECAAEIEKRNDAPEDRGGEDERTEQ